MKEISTIQEAEDYIFNYDFFINLNENKETLYPLLKSCEQLAIQHKNDKLLCRSRTYLIYLYIEENKLDLASDLAGLNLQYAKEKQLEDELLYMIAIIAHLYQLTGNYSASEELIQIALDKIPVLQDDKKICKIYLMVAEQYYFTNDKQRCIDTYKKAIEYAYKTGDHTLTALCFINYSDKLLQYGELENAGKALSTGLASAHAANNESLIALLNGNYGYYYFLKQEYSKAIAYLHTAVQYFRAQQVIDKEMLFAIDLARCYFKTGELEKGYELLIALEKHATASAANRILQTVHELFVEYFEAKKDYFSALQFLKKHNEISAIIKNEESEDKIRNLQIRYDLKTIQSERDNAAKLARIKHDFLANMSHEIRTPINSILGIGYLLQQDQLTPKQQNYVERINQSGTQLLGIINDILDLSKIEAGKFHLSLLPFSVQKLVDDIQQALSVKAQEKSITFTALCDPGIPAYCLGDVTRVGQILTNLAYNAIKFTEKGSVLLTAKLLSQREQDLLIGFTVTDTGIGMSAEQCHKIFNEYEQAETTTQQKFGGTGLGLSISKKLTDLMNGTLTVESEINKGSVFHLSMPFPVAEKTEPVKNEPGLSCASLSGKLIYIADDIEENRRVMEELLLSLNPDVRIGSAINGKELLQKLSEQTPDIILMDLDMPEINGLEATGIIRQKHQSEEVSIVACTASLLTLTQEELKAIGFNHILLKPYTVQQLSAVLI